jgi:hypothetical protein
MNKSCLYRSLSSPIDSKLLEILSSSGVRPYGLLGGSFASVVAATTDVVDGSGATASLRKASKRRKDVGTVLNSRLGGPANDARNVASTFQIGADDHNMIVATTVAMNLDRVCDISNEDDDDDAAVTQVRISARSLDEQYGSAVLAAATAADSLISFNDANKLPPSNGISHCDVTSFVDLSYPLLDLNWDQILFSMKVFFVAIFLNDNLIEVLGCE